MYANSTASPANEAKAWRKWRSRGYCESRLLPVHSSAPATARRSTSVSVPCRTCTAAGPKSTESTATRSRVASIFGPIRASRTELVAVRQRIQKRHDVRDVGLAQRGLIAAVSIEGSLGVDIVPILFRQIVEFQCDAIRPPRVPLLRLGVALGVKAHHIVQAVQDAVVKEHAASRRIAQRGGAEEAAVFPSVRQVDAQRPAQAQVVIFPLRIGGDIHVARRTDGGVTKIRELRKGALAHAAGMTARAITLRRIIERGQAPQFVAAHRYFMPHPGVVLAAVGVELRRALLKCLQRHQHRLERQG